MPRQAGPRAFYHAARLQAATLSPQAQERARWLSAWQVLWAQGLNSTRASEVLALPRSTLYRWQQRLKGHGPPGLGPRSRRPRHLRQPTPPLAESWPKLSSALGSSIPAEARTSW